jgi:hypothetical protein
MANSSYTEDVLNRWIENSRQLRRDFKAVEELLAKAETQRAQERLKAITIAAKQLGRSLDELEAAATHPWVSSAHKSIMEKVRADEWQAKSAALQKTIKRLEGELELQEENKRSEVSRLSGIIAKLKVRIKELQQENEAFRDPASLFGSGVERLKK